jgi:hypothetical protein
MPGRSPSRSGFEEEFVMLLSYVVLALVAASVAGLGGTVVGWAGASTVAFFGRSELVRRAAVFTHLCSGPRAAS